MVCGLLGGHRRGEIGIAFRILGAALHNQVVAHDARVRVLRTAHARGLFDPPTHIDIHRLGGHTGPAIEPFRNALALALAQQLHVHPFLRMPTIAFLDASRFVLDTLGFMQSILRIHI